MIYELTPANREQNRRRTVEIEHSICAKCRKRYGKRVWEDDLTSYSVDRLFQPTNCPQCGDLLQWVSGEEAFKVCSRRRLFVVSVAVVIVIVAAIIWLYVSQ
jgi:hypothetical protein